MRSPDEQEEFLKHGRFGDEKQKVAKARIPLLVKIGLDFIGMGCATLATSAILAELARERGQWYLVVPIRGPRFIAVQPHTVAGEGNKVCHDGRSVTAPLQSRLSHSCIVHPFGSPIMPFVKSQSYCF